MIEIGRAAKLIGFRRDAIYKMIKKGTIPYEQKVAFGRSAYRIPLPHFLEWLEREMSGLQKRLTLLSQSHKKVKEVLSNGRSA